jgi:hypothetical protein
MEPKPSFVISCHADTGIHNHRLSRNGEELITGHLDNFVGVHAVMQAYFSGRRNFKNCKTGYSQNGQNPGLPVRAFETSHLTLFR